MARETKTRGIRWKLWLGLAVAGAACVSSALAAYRMQRFVATDPRFTLSADRPDALEIQGLRFASRAKVKHVFAADFGYSIFRAPLAERLRRLKGVDWVREASVSRLWPDRLLVRVAERQPVAFVFFPTGMLLIDGEGRLLEPPPQAQFTFPVLSGVREGDSDADLRERRRRVEAMQRLLNDVGPRAQEISVVETADPENLKVMLHLNGKLLELIMGDTNYGQRFQNFLTRYPEIRRSSPNATVFDLRLDGRATATE
jgi:cell division protein FtsQ